MKKILVTGGAGFIGANFVQYLLSHNQDCEVIVLDALTYAGNLANLLPVREDQNFSFIKGDICDPELVPEIFRTQEIDIVVHFAAESHVDRSITGPDAFIESNIVGTHNLLKNAKTIWEETGGFENKLFHHVSTDEVYGTLGPHDPAFSELTPYAPNSPYAASKAGSDHLVRAYHHTFGLPVTTSNCSNNYGPYQFPEKLLPLCLLNILEGKPLPIYGDGKQVRDWLYVDDHSSGIMLILENGVPGETYNIGGNNEWTNIDTVKLLCEIVDMFFIDNEVLCSRFPKAPPASQGGLSESLITIVKDRPGHDVRYAINAEKISSTLGYKPALEFRKGLEKTVKWYLDNQDWWQSVKDGSYRMVYK